MNDDGPANRERVLVRLVAEACDALGVSLSRHCHDWLLRLGRGGVVRHVLGYQFDLNPHAGGNVAGDKAAAAAALEAAGVACVPHELLPSPALAACVGAAGVVSPALDLWRRWGGDLAVKPNEGTGGRGVARCRTAGEVEAALLEIFATERAACAAPWLDGAREVRCVVLDGQPLVTYEKRRPQVTGDGRRTVRQLVADSPLPAEVLADLAAEGPAGLARLAAVPAAGETIVVGDRHNLARAATPADVDAPDAARLAAAACAALNLRAASVDVFADADAGEPRVLEVNAGIMLERYALAGDAQRARAADVYRRLVAAMFDL